MNARPTPAQIFAAPPATPDAGSLNLALIELGERLRPVDEDWAAALAEQIEGGAELPPVIVRPHGAGGGAGRYVLVVGAHRLRAHAIAGRATIAASIRDMSAAEARLAEIDENLFRAELTVLDRALCLAARKRVWEELHPATRNGGDRKSLTRKVQNQNEIISFCSEAAEKVGIGRRAVELSVALASRLEPEAIALIRRTYLADHLADLQALSRLDHERQLAALGALVDGRAATLAEALGRETADPQDRFVVSFIGRWARLRPATKRRILQHIGLSRGEIADVLRRAPTRSAARPLASDAATPSGDEGNVAAAAEIPAQDDA